MRLLRRVWPAVSHAGAPQIIGVVVAGSLVGYVISIGVAPKSGGQLWAIVRSAWWPVLLLTFPYLLLRLFIWRQLLEELDIHLPRRPLLAAFAGGEMAKFLPAGVYVENFLLSRGAYLHELGTIRSTVATTATLGLESLVAVPVLLILGLPGEPWLRWTLLGVVGAWLVLLGLVWFLVRFGARFAAGEPLWLRHGLRYAGEVLDAVPDLLTWRTLVNLVPTALYLLLYAVELYLVARAVGVRQLSFLDAIAVYAFIVLTVVLIPIPTELGLTEFSGLTALLAFGIDHATAAMVMLGLRALSSGFTILVAGAALLAFRRGLVTGGGARTL